jgi:hypothetical protein
MREGWTWVCVHECAYVNSPVSLRSLRQISTAIVGDTVAIGPVAEQQFLIFDIQIAHEANARRALGRRLDHL